VNKPLHQWGETYPHLAPMCQAISEKLIEKRGGERGDRKRTWESQFTIEPPSTAVAPAPAVTAQFRVEQKRTLLVRGTFFGAASEHVATTTFDGSQDRAEAILVLDDITRLIQAQRDAAWGEVARRLAHEIKNPLTPIQLSAERMAMKLADKLGQQDRDMLQRSTHTIVAQVAALKGMVDDFSLYSRASRIKLGPVELNELVIDVLTLYESIPIKLTLALAPSLPTVRADPALLRQVLHNLVQNAQDALQGAASPEIVIRTEQHDNELLLSVADNGSGIREDVLGRIFEPYVTTKSRGTGLGLPIVKKIIEEHQGRVVAENRLSVGAAITIILPIAHPSLFSTNASTSNSSTQSG
jgi:nitrogen fixation/metabolism regulation signal transduction histidine kinase